MFAGPALCKQHALVQRRSNRYYYTGYKLAIVFTILETTLLSLDRIGVYYHFLTRIVAGE